MSEEHKTIATEEGVKSEPLKTLPDLKSLREVRGLTTEDISVYSELWAKNTEKGAEL